ncbi:Uncharacterized protein TPAR_05011 [Tolypocladium paradoxum]|uniref:Metallo-beta-lactamase domain-containing protein n=1 Tax=Tolypocladium paradoxum TaxID=94208 RepID=A0A2S4KXB0_9HYPO|nr:Uncharacterized protein TPAR_05011 [Tolypocladium paradoxum]
MRRRHDLFAAVLALAGNAVACLHQGHLQARWPGPSLSLSSENVPSMKRQSRSNIPVFFGMVQNTTTPMLACFAGGSEGKVPQNTIAKKNVNLRGERFDPNLELGVTVYFPLVSENCAIMFDTQTSPTLASACLDFMSEMGVGVNNVVLSHKHQDHVNGLSAAQLNNVPVIAQKNTKTALARGKGRLPDQTFGETQTLSFGGAKVDLVHFKGHTNDGTGACMGDFCLMGDECEDNIPFIAEPNRIGQQIQNLGQTIQTVQSKSIQKVCPAHGNGATIFNGCFTLDLCKSNLNLNNSISGSIIFAHGYETPDTPADGKCIANPWIGQFSVQAVDFNILIISIVVVYTVFSRRQIIAPSGWATGPVCASAWIPGLITSSATSDNTAAWSPSSMEHGYQQTPLRPVEASPVEKGPFPRMPASPSLRNMLLMNGYPIAYIILWIPGIVNRLVESTRGSLRWLAALQSKTQFVGMANALTYGFS